MTKIWLGAAAVALIECLMVAAAFIRPRAKRVEGDDLKTRVDAGPVQKFANASVTAFVRHKFYLARQADGGFLALSCKCTHLGCTIPWVSQTKRFECPCHASAFDMRGEVIRAPAPRALDIYPVTIENNLVKVDVGRRTKRDQFRPDQLVYPKQG
jgi:cytochrome b6-f complex iron-sulfur subunit